MKFTWIAFGTFVLVLCVAAAFFAIRIKEGPSPALSNAQPVPKITLVSVSDSYHKGTHTISGTALLPTPCTPFTATSSAAVNGVIRVDITSAYDSGLCLELAATTSWSVTQSGTSTDAVQVFVNGAQATDTAP